MKTEARVIGIDDSPFVKRKDKKVLLVGVVYRGGVFPDGVVTTYATVDGTDATEKIASMINKCRFRTQLQAIMLQGVAVGGFNVIDIHKLHKLTRRPVVVVVRNYPDLEEIFRVLKWLKKKKAISLIKKLPKPKQIGKVYVQFAGTNLKSVKELLRITSTRAFIPEPLRVAHLIAAGVVKGQSRGRA